MQKNIVLQTLTDPTDVKRLADYLKELYSEMDDLQLTSSPVGVVSARKGRGALVTSGGNYYRYVNIDGATGWRGVQLTLSS